jgi:hypothetical protein
LHLPAVPALNMEATSAAVSTRGKNSTSSMQPNHSVLPATEEAAT